MNKQFVMALIASGALVGLGGCSEGDEANITIDASTTDNSVTNPPPTTDPTPPPTDPTPPPTVQCPSGTTEVSSNVCRLSGRIVSDMTLVAGNTYELDGRVIVGNGNCEAASTTACASGESIVNVTLTIEPGVEVKGLPSNDPLTAAVLDVNRGSRLMAMGTAASPIIFSSAVDDDYSGSGEWGGIQLTGFAPHNDCGAAPCNVLGEGAVDFIGGEDPEDSSGVMQYVIITEGGTVISTGDEINGLSLNAVGSGTVLEFIQINDNFDDGVEYYGGTVNTKYLVVTGAGDDSVDWDEGFQGNLQYVIVRQTANSEGEAFEMDTEGSLAFLSKPTLSNVTVIADKAAGENEFSLNFKASSAGFFHNTVVTVEDGSANTFTTCANIVDGAENNVGTSLVFNNWIQDCANGAGDQGILANIDMGGAAINVTPVAAALNSFAASTASAAILDAPLDWAAINSSLSESVADVDYLDGTDYIGAVDPRASSAWWAGWTLDGSVGNPETPVVACPTGTTEVDTNVCRLPAQISSDMRLVAGNEYQLQGRVIVGNGNCERVNATTCASGASIESVTLTIDAGVEVKGLPSDDPLTAAVLDVNRGSQLVARGTRSAPIIFSSAVDDDYFGSGEWGGIQLSGFAPHNDCQSVPCDILGEGAVNFIGGEDPADSSGIMEYVIITEGGTVISTGDEINGLSLNAVGSGTTLDYIQINDNFDDGIEYYGGTVDTKHLVVTGAGDDSVDWDEGFQGNLQYVIVKQTPNSEGEAFEMDTEGSLAWLSKPTVVNATVIADKAAGENEFSLNFKASSAGFFHNTVVTVAEGTANTFTSCALISDGAENNINTSLVFNNWIQDCANGAGNGGSLANDEAAAIGNSSVIIADASLDATLASQAPQASGVPLINWDEIAATFEVPNSAGDDPQDFNPDFFDATDYMGAVNPDGSDLWWSGWTLSGSL